MEYIKNNKLQSITRRIQGRSATRPNGSHIRQNNQIFFLTYCLNIFIASMIPGPSTMLALMQGARHDWIAGILNAANLLSEFFTAIVKWRRILEVKLFKTGIYDAKH